MARERILRWRPDWIVQPPGRSLLILVFCDFILFRQLLLPQHHTDRAVVNTPGFSLGWHGNVDSYVSWGVQLSIMTGWSFNQWS